MDARGEERWDVVTRLPLLDREGHIVGIIVIFRDVTEQMRAEAKIHEAVRLRDQFLAMLSHELRNPLGAIVTATAMLKQNAADGHDQTKERRSLAIVERQALQMARLLDDLLEASRVTQNKIELRRRVLDLRPVASEAAEAVRASMQERGLSFEAVLPDEPLHVDGDPARLQQIQMNLLSNAAKYTPPGGHVRFSVLRDGDDAVVRVRDDGAGLPPSMAESIFDLFVQATRTLDRASGGLGLGLTLVRALVEMHGGTVTAHSDGEGCGSEFVVRLPLARRPADQPEEPAAERSRADAQRVMVVEDNADSREALCALLEAAGYDCRSAASGTAALALVDAFAPSVVVLDLGLPEVDGFEIARRIRTDARHDAVRLVALTGYGQAADRAASLSAGFDEHIVKPVHPERLLDLLARLHAPVGLA
jgi:two-component system CheB/CheR fusion protein